MLVFLSRRPGRVLLGVATLLPGLLGVSLAPQKAAAAISYCRTDPVVYLSDGVKVSLTAEIAGKASDIRSVTYTLHMPVGVTITHIVFTHGQLGHVEQFRSYGDGVPRSYDSDTVAETTTQGVSARATTTVLDQVNSVKASGSASGETGQDLSVHLTT